jgi:hypothetical protein
MQIGFVWVFSGMAWDLHGKYTKLHKFMDEKRLVHDR